MTWLISWTRDGSSLHQCISTYFCKFLEHSYQLKLVQDPNVALIQAFAGPWHVLEPRRVNSFLKTHVTCPVLSQDTLFLRNSPLSALFFSYSLPCLSSIDRSLNMKNGSGRNSTADAPRSRKRFVSYRLRGEYEKPWLQDPKFKRTKINNYIVYGFMGLGVAAAGAVAYLEISGSLPTEVCVLTGVESSKSDYVAPAVYDIPRRLPRRSA